MRLKRLILKGFKSFADETVIHFNENLIGIVGPNGSGKSNIVDSIRWVLGEQKTSELRLDSMSDVIFNGSKDRKEGKIAKVTLLFDNTKHILPTEFNEVGISRILYRNGSSEYQLNNVACRKKDITNLFIDSGIGSNSYAIISLNMVEDILHDNGGSRRHMIEQAAGISKYKVRKKETLSKLRSTTEDLDRVQDLLFEIEKNMTSFERQARRTERYNKLKTQYKDLSIHISHYEVRELNARHKELSERLVQENDSRLKLNSKLTLDEAELQKIKAGILKYEKSLSADQQEFNQLIEDLGKTENAKNLTIQRLQNAKDRLGETKASKAQLKRAVQDTTSNLKESEKTFKSSEKTLSDKEKAFERIDLEYQAALEAYESLRNREKELKSALSSRQLLKETLGREIESFKTREAILKEDISSLEERLHSINDKIQIDTRETKEKQKTLNDLLKKEEKILKEISKLESQYEEIQGLLIAENQAKNELDLEVSSLEQRRSFLLNIIENKEGLPESVKYILEQNGQEFQVLSDVIDIKEERYTKIAELFIEPFLHHVLVPNRIDADKIFDKVRNAQKGKINVAILDEFEKEEKVEQYDGLSPLSDHINAPSNVKVFVDYLCNDVYVSHIPYKDYSDRIKKTDQIVLFPDEYIIASKGKIYGGSNTLFEGVQLGRKKIVEKLEKQIDSQKKRKEALGAKIHKLDDQVSQVQIDLKELKASKVQFNSLLDTQKSSVFESQSRLNSLNENKADLSDQKNQKEAELKEIAKVHLEKSKEYAQLENRKIEEESDEKLALKIEKAHRNYLEEREKRDAAQSDLFEWRSNFNLSKKDMEYFRDNVLNIEKRIAELLEEEEIQNGVINGSETELGELKKALETQYALKSEIQKKLSAYEDTYYKEKGKIFELEKTISQTRNDLYTKDQLIVKINEEYANIGFEIKGIHERNSIEFGIQIDESNIPDFEEEINPDELKEKKEKIFDRIRSFGEINPMAITAYNEIKERHDEISRERNDILEAKKSLEVTIAEIEKTASERFIDALDRIRVNFKDVFQSLFSDDDDCDIVLLDSEDPLEAKIEIVAKPKGKKPKSINQLSGGEKTLTASSFLFSLYLLKPAPFCIFDEVDAPLDDVNVLKFNKLIRNFSEESQFIIITHNKLTMQEVDILYGIYLKEQGVSGLSAVDFRTYDQTEMIAISE